MQLEATGTTHKPALGTAVVAGLHDAIRRQTRAGGLHAIVRGVMQPHPVLFRVLPAIGADVIEPGAKLAQCARQYLGLLWGWLQFEPYSALHRVTLPYTTSFRNVNEGEGLEKALRALSHYFT